MRYLFVILIICTVLIMDSLQDINHAINGFVEFPQEDIKVNEYVDYSKIEIHLMNEDRVLIEKTNCTENGYYLLPIYDAKNYILQIFSKEDLIFSPLEKRIDLQNKSPEEIQEILEEYYNFKFVGFSIKNKVSTHFSKEKELGPEGVELAIFDKDGKELSQETSNNEGKFQFENLMIGKYKIKAKNTKNDEYLFLKGKDEIDCEISWKERDKCKGELIVQGFRVKGKILNENIPMENFNLVLGLKEENKKIEELINCKKNQEDRKKNNFYLCSDISNNNGEFDFGILPFGKYIVKIHSVEKDKNIEIYPSSFEINVENKPIYENKIFDINKFSITGQVFDQNMKGLMGVKILLDGEEKAITNKSGFYKLEMIKTGTYTLEGQHEHLFFEPLHDLKLSVNLKQVPNLILSYLHLCGNVKLNFENAFHGNKEEFQKTKITIYLESKTEKRTTFLNSEGKYCFEVKPGTYVISPSISNLKKEHMIALSPEKQEVMVQGVPELSVNFERKKVDITGNIFFLKGLENKNKIKTNVLIYSIDRNTKQSIVLKTDSFQFSNILPGKYVLEVENFEICWEKHDLEIFIQNSNITNLQFKQKGWALNYFAPIDISGVLQEGKGKSTNIVFPKNEKMYCLQAFSNYTFMPDTCFWYNQSSFSFSTKEKIFLDLTPHKLLIQGKLLFKKDKKKQENLLVFRQLITENCFVSINEKHREKLQFIQENEEDLIFEYKHFVTSNTKNFIEPQVTLKKGKNIENFLENILFQPERLEIDVEDNCRKEGTDFEIKIGLVFFVNIEPEIQDYTLKLFEGNNKNILLYKIEASNKTVKLGPVIEKNVYEVEIEKEGYKFAQIKEERKENVRNISFIAQRLSTIRIEVVDEKNQPIPGVMIFISSTSKTNLMRINKNTDENGIFINNNFVKGTYLVKAILKEYLFDPPQQTLEIKDGSHQNLKMTGKKIYFSVFGSVQNINHEGMKDLEIQAFLITNKTLSNNPVETAFSQINGKYRIRGLKPNGSYILKLKHNDNIDFYKPEDFYVQMKEQDIHNIDFIIWEKKHDFQISGTLNFSSKFTNDEIEEIFDGNLEIQIFNEKDKNFENPLQVPKLQFYRYFEFSKLEKKNYVVKIKYKIGKNALANEKTETFTLENLPKSTYSMFQNVNLVKQSSLNKKKYLDGLSLMGPLFLLLLVFSFLNLDKTQMIIQQFFSYFKSEPKSKKKHRKKD